MCKTCGCGMTNPKAPGYGKGKPGKKGADKKAPAKKKK
jgi:hypothetical protein